jgi:glycosyltransferase involved in cell wall biosynthesis
MSTPSFAVVIPLYNKALHIRATLQSVFNQTVQPDEIIIVDDGSTDGSGEIVAAISHPLLKLIRQQNSGESAARNTGLREAVADYVAFLDADDSWHDCHIEELKKLIDKYPTHALYSTMHQVRYNGLLYTPRAAYLNDFSGAVDDFFSRFAYGLSLVNSTTACVHRESLLKLGGFPVGVKIGPDLITWVKLARLYGMAHSGRVTATYNRDAVNRVSKIRKKEPPGSLIYLSALLQDQITDDVERKGIRLLFSNIAFFCAAGMRATGDLGGVIGILALVCRMGMWLLMVKISVLFLTPSWCLMHARRWRHRHPVLRT